MAAFDRRPGHRNRGCGRMSAALRGVTLGAVHRTRPTPRSTSRSRARRNRSPTPPRIPGRSSGVIPHGRDDGNGIGAGPVRGDRRELGTVLASPLRPRTSKSSTRGLRGPAPLRTSARRDLSRGTRLERTDLSREQPDQSESSGSHSGRKFSSTGSGPVLYASRQLGPTRRDHRPAEIRRAYSGDGE